MLPPQPLTALSLHSRHSTERVSLLRESESRVETAAGDEGGVAEEEAEGAAESLVD